MEGPDDLLVDDWAAKAKNLKVGDTFNVLNHDWHIAGIVEHGKGARLFVPLTTLQELSAARDKASIFLVKCTRPEHTDDVMEEMRHLLPNYTVRPLKDFLSLMTSTNIPGLQSFINAMIALAVCIGLLVIFLTMYTSVIERRRPGCARGFAERRRCIGCRWTTGKEHAHRFRLRQASRGPTNHDVDLDYAGMDFQRGHDCTGRGDAGRNIPSVDGQPERRGGGFVLRLSRKETARQGVTKEYRIAEERRVAESGKDGSQVAAKRDRLQ